MGFTYIIIFYQFSRCYNIKAMFLYIFVFKQLIDIHCIKRIDILPYSI